MDAVCDSHADMRSYDRSVFILGNVPIITGSSIQKRSVRGSAEIKTNGVDGSASKIMRTKKLISHQG